MRKVFLGCAIAALLITVVPSHAATDNWASYAIGSTQYSDGNAAGAAGIAGPLLNSVLCLVFSQTVCPPDPNDIADAITGAPDAIQSSLDGVQNGSWAASQATGAPNVYPDCGDRPNAWAPFLPDVPILDPVGLPVDHPSSVNEPEALAVFYNPPVTDAKSVNIYETNIGGFVTSVEVVLANGASMPVFTGPDTTPCPGILSIPLSAGPAVATVVIHTQASGWEEIDAVSVQN